MKLEIQKFGGRGASSSAEEYSLAVQENPKYKRELGKSRYAVQFRNGNMSVIDFNSNRRTGNAEKSNHSLDAYSNMKVYQRTDGGDIYLLTQKQMDAVNKKMPTRSEYQADREKTMQNIEKLVKQNANKTIKKKRK
ncbi:MAG: hypothetical protein J6S67_05950 [Methanobrevibacter sp.]|nr:hypothetical protein [Methanobrevibacter sp.]